MAACDRNWWNNSEVNHLNCIILQQNTIIFNFSLFNSDSENDMNYYEIPVDIKTLDDKQLDQMDDSQPAEDDAVMLIYKF